MMKYLRSLVDIRKGELAVTFLLLANIYILLVTYYFLKPARDSLFLTKLGADQLPLVFILIAFVIVPITTLYSKASRSLKLNHLINATLGIVIASLFVLRWMMGLPYFWVPYVFYIWVSIYGVLTTSQFWLMANAVYDAAQAKRLFALLGLGAILGAWTGGEVTSIIVSTFGVSTEDLLFYCAGLIAISMILTTVTWSLNRTALELQGSPGRKRSERKESLGEMFADIRRSRHLLLIVGIITMTMLVASFVDFQFKAVATNSFRDAVTGEVDQAGLTAFMGTFYGRLSLVSLLLQLVFAYRFLRVLGVGGVILFLPLGLLVGSVAMLFSVSLVAAVLLRGADGSLRYSIDKTGRELLFLPVPLDLKKRTKVFIDMFVDRWARGVSGGLLLLLIALFNYDSDPVEAIRLMSFVVAGMLAVWIALCLLMRREYVNTFRKAIEKREIDLSEVRISINESSTVNTLINSLQSGNEREVVYALNMLTEVNNINLIEPLRPLLKHRSAEIRRKTIHVLMAQKDASLLNDVKELLDDDDMQVCRDAMYFVLNNSDNDGMNMLKVFLTHPRVRYRYIAVSCVALYGSDEQKQMIDEATIESLVNLPDDDGVQSRRQIAEALGYLNDRRLRKYFKRFLNDSDDVVVRNTIESIGKAHEREHVPWLINALGNRRFRRDSLLALSAFGLSVLGTLFDYLTDSDVDPAIRRQIPRVMSRIPHQETVDMLTAGLERVDPSLKYHVVKALNRIRSGHPGLRFNETKVDEALLKETRNYYEIIRLISLQAACDDDSAKLLLKALEEKRDQNLERIFRLLGLAYPPADIYSAYLGIVSRRRTQKASAIEFLDNLLKGNMKRYLLPILDESSVEHVIRKGQELFGIRMTSTEEALLYLISGRDNWLKACAIYHSADNLTPALKEAVESAAGDGDPVVRETARVVLARVNNV